MNFVEEFHRRLDRDWLSRHILNLYRIERKQTFPAWQEAARYVHDLLVAEGFAPELIDFPSDGVTAYQDKGTPMGWDVSRMRLTVLSQVEGLDDPVVSDYEREPLMAVKGSVGTGPEGLTARLVTEGQMKAGEDVGGAFVLLDPPTRPRGEVMRMLLDLGAHGWVSDYLENPHTTPDSVSWINAGTENNSWHVQAEDRDFISFQITPRTGFALRAACEKGAVTVRAESDGRRYATTLPAVTALLPGESGREVWMVAHLYEPLIDDNSNGVVGAVGILKILRDMAQKGEISLKYGVRVVFAGEMYGFAAVAEHFGGNLAERALGGINMDGIMATTQQAAARRLRARPAADHLGGGRPDGFAGNVLFDAVAEEFAAALPQYTMEPMSHTLGDDCFLGDASVGLPVVWYLIGEGGYHHNSFQDEGLFDVEVCADHLSCCGAWVRAMAALTAGELTALLPAALERGQRLLDGFAALPARPGEDKADELGFLYRREYHRLAGLRQWADVPALDEALRALRLPEAALPEARPAVSEKSWLSYADGFVLTRVGRGFPHDLLRLPYTKRRPMPGAVLYDDLADVFSRMDGKKTLGTLIRETQWDKGIAIGDETVRGYFSTCVMLAEAGYLELHTDEPLSAAALTEALRRLGVGEGDTLLVHSSLSRMGYLPGGALSVIAALRAAVGESGTFLAPAFARPYVMFEGILNKSLAYRPYDTRPGGALRDRTVSTGALPRTMLRSPDACRSGHATHEWVGLGADAAGLLAGHGFLDAPTGGTSPLGGALRAGGSVVFLGCSAASNTFLHYIEDCADAPYLQPAVIRYLDAAGEYHTEIIRRHLPGHRNFYGDPAKSGFYQEALRRGLRVSAQPFGMATLYRMELRELFDIGMSIFRDDPCATLCRDPDCAFCRSFRCGK